MHNLLKRQLKKYFGDPLQIPTKWQKFVDAVDDAYMQSDVDRGMLERSLDLSSQELLHANSEMMADKNKLQSMIDAMEYGLTIQDSDYNIIYQNEVLKNIFGARLGEKCYIVYEGKDKVCDGCPVEIAIKDGKSHTSDRRVIMPSGEITFWENTANPIIDASGEIVSCLEIARNITSRKKMEVEIKNRIKELEEFYDMAVGRELRMIELKNEIEKMEKELEKYKKLTLPSINNLP